jgi:uncharacterized protein (DUF1015 family)
MNRVITGDESWVFQCDKVVEDVMEISRLTSSLESADVKVKVKTMFMFYCVDQVPYCKSAQEICVFLGTTFYGIFCRTS